jgi:multidrug resistance protein MdtO
MMMLLVFDQLWGASAAVAMRRTFISNFRLVAQLVRDPISKDLKTATAPGLALCETINTNLDKLRALDDGVLLEFGPSRERDLALRDRIRRWQPRLRMLFIIRAGGEDLLSRQQRRPSRYLLPFAVGSI